MGKVCFRLTNWIILLELTSSRNNIRAINPVQSLNPPPRTGLMVMVFVLDDQSVLVLLFQYWARWNMCLSLLYPDSKPCKSLNKKQRFKNKLFFLLWIENISNKNISYFLLSGGSYQSIINSILEFLGWVLWVVCSVFGKSGAIDILSVAMSNSLTLGSKIAEKKNTTVSVYLLVRKESFVWVLSHKSLMKWKKNSILLFAFT